MQWALAFGTFLAVALLARLGLEWLMDAWWSSEGLDPAARPPLNDGGEWLVSGGIGLAAGWLVTRIFGEN